MKFKHTARFVRAHTVEHPATVLESTLASTGEKTTIAEIPASTAYFTEGQVVPFGTKRSALDFVKAMSGAAVYEATEKKS